jgi:AcrR family transcriptional regulator
MNMTERTSKGRPLDTDLTQRVLSVVRSQLEVHGFANLSVEKVASAVGCGKTAIYRRWPTKPELVAAAILDNSEIGEMPDSGDVVEDLVEHAWQNLENLRRSKDKAENNGLLLAMFNIDVVPIISESFMQPRHAMAREILARGVAQGQVNTDLDHDLIIDSLAGLTLFRTTLKPGARARTEEEFRASYRNLVRSLLGSPS